MEKDQNLRSGVVPESCTYAVRDTAQSNDFEYRGVSQREKPLDNLRTVSGIEI